MKRRAVRLSLVLTLSFAATSSLVFTRTGASLAHQLASKLGIENQTRNRVRFAGKSLVTPAFLGATYTVTTTADNLDNNNPTSGSLRAAIREANLNPGADTIQFNIPGAGPHTINVGAGLPDIKDSVTIDGYTQPGAAANTLPDGNDAVIKIEIKGQANLFGNGLVIAASDCLVQGLAIHAFNHAVYLTGERTVAGANRNIVRGNFIGTNVTGTATSVDFGDGTANGVGILIDGGGFKPNGDPGTANNNIIGGTSPDARNVIAGNGSAGVLIQQNIAAASATGNLIQGNFIGTNSAGTAGLGDGDGVLIRTPSNTVGGTDAGARNVIAGNNYNPFTSDGVNLDGPNAHDNFVQGNLIGTDVTGTVAIPNGVNGVTINGGANNNTVGGLTASARNIISGNTVHGVSLGNGSGNKIQGNYIGTDVTGTAGVGNRFVGVQTGQSTGATIGGIDFGAGNLISANLRGGIDIDGTNTVVQGNLIGTKADGVSPLGNAQFGVRVFRANNLIGGRTSGAGNVIAFTRFADPFSDNAIGVIVYGGNTNATIVGNSIYSNEGIGIDLGRNWITLNDTCDSDSSDGTSNQLQNFPVLTSAAGSGGNTTIAGTLNSAPGTTFTLDFYANPACDSYNYGEGQTYLGSATTLTDANCNASFNATLPVAVPAGQVVTATATDPGGNTSEFSTCVTVTSSNSPPDAVNDFVTTDEDTPVTISVLANDTDPDNDALTITSFTQGANGSVTNNGDGTLTYTPNANYNGSDAFSYTIGDGQGGSDSATVTIAINPVADPPAAVDDGASTNEDVPLDINVLANDTPGDCDGVVLASITQPAHGSVIINADNTVRYTPNANFNGTDSFTYSVRCANSNASAGRMFAHARRSRALATTGSVGNVSVNVTPVNDAPVAGNDAYSVDEDSSLTVEAPGLLGNDTDVEGDAFTAVLTHGPSRGKLTLNPDGSFIYTSIANYNGPDSFTYQAKDANDALSNIATVIITVNSVNDLPQAEDQSLSTDEDTIKFIFLTATDADGEPLTYSIVTQPEHGSLSGGGRNYSYTPAANYSGPDAFTFKANDGTVDSNIATVSIMINAVNDAPDAVNDSVNTDEDTPVNISVLINDTDAEGDPIALVSVTRPSRGNAVVNGDGTVTYTPRPEFSGTDSFQYTISDGKGGADTATVFITVTPVNDPPDALDDTASTKEDTLVNIDVLANDFDRDGSVAPVLQSVTQGANGSVSINANKTVRYIPSLNFNGTDSFTYTIADQQGATATGRVIVTVTPVVDLPVAVSDEYTMNINTTLTVSAPGVLGNDINVDHLPIKAFLANGTAHGTLTLNDDGSFSYTPKSGFSGCDIFDYQAGVNIYNLSLPATVTIIIKSEPDPLANGPLALTRNGSLAYRDSSEDADSFSLQARGGGEVFTSPNKSAGSPSWTRTTKPDSARVFHTATLLRDGKVLVSGGTSNAVKELLTGKSFLKTTEIYDPSTDTWRRTGDLNTARGNHTATLLPDGRVLVTGGMGDSGAFLRSAEIYDPANGKWTRTPGSLTFARATHTATLLGNGRVLIAGGIGNNLSTLDSAEIYDPATNSFTAAHNLTSGRWAHTATIVPTGKVLITGGYGFGGSFIQNTAEIYDPAADTWKRTHSNLNSARAHHSATRLLNGKILLTGGLGLNGILNSAEVYDPASDTFRMTQGHLNTGRWLHAAVLLRDGRVLVAGGNSDNNFGHEATDSAELYDPATGTWTNTAKLFTGRHGATANLLYNNKILVIGGMHAAATLNSAELYDTLDTRRLFSTCSSITPVALHGDGFHGNSRISKIENGTVPCMNSETEELSQCQFLTEGPSSSGIWLEATDGRYALTGQGLTLQGEPGGQWIVAARVNNDGTVPCVAPSGHDTAGQLAEGEELAVTCTLEDNLAPYNALMSVGFNPLWNYATQEVCTSTYPHPDFAELTRIIDSCTGPVYCYKGQGAALNDPGGMERDINGLYIGFTFGGRKNGSNYCHFLEEAGYEVPAAKRPATKSFPAPGRVNVNTPLLWRPVDPNTRIAN